MVAVAGKLVGRLLAADALGDPAERSGRQGQLAREYVECLAQICPRASSACSNPRERG